MKAFCKDLRQGADSADNLGSFMRTGLSTSETHSQLLPIIKRFGGIFSEISSSQHILADSLERTFVIPLETFYKNEVSKIKSMKQQYHSQRDNLDVAIQRYIQCDGNNFRNHPNPLDYRAYEVVLQRRRFEIARFDLVKKVNELEARKSFELAESCIAAIFSLRTHHHTCMDHLDACKPFAENLQIRQRKERLAFKNMMGPLDNKRQEIYAILDGIVNRAKMQSPLLQTDQGSDSDVLGMDNVSPSEEVPSASQPANRTSKAAPSLGALSLSRIGALGANIFGGIAKGTVTAISSSVPSYTAPGGTVAVSTDNASTAAPASVSVESLDATMVYHADSAVEAQLNPMKSYPTTETANTEVRNLLLYACQNTCSN